MAQIRSLLTLAAIAGLVYFALTQMPGTAESADAGDHASSDCAAAISARFDGQSVKPYAVEKNRRGFVVRASVTVRGTQSAKVLCLANEYGGVEEIRVVEH